MADNDIVGAVMAYEAGELDDADTLALFATLIRSGDAWRLQGHYGRTAAALISSGRITPDGVITGE